jgi:hypothetical protein
MSGAAARALCVGEHAHDVTLTTVAEGAADADTGDPAETETTASIRGITDPSGAPSILHTSAGEDIEIDLVLHVLEEDAPADPPPFESASITVDGHEYEVAYVAPAELGTRRLMCTRLRS